jgi:hypothetical protein
MALPIESKKCKGCGIAIFPKANEKKGSFSRTSFCSLQCGRAWRADLCRKNGRAQTSRSREKIESLTIEEAFNGSKTQDSKWQLLRRSLAHWARRLYQRANMPMICLVCRYEKHVEIAHKTGIFKFPKNTRLGEVNRLSNLIALCPNHHWEFDNGFISADKIEFLQAHQGVPRPGALEVALEERSTRPYRESLS